MGGKSSGSNYGLRVLFCINLRVGARIFPYAREPNAFFSRALWSRQIECSNSHEPFAAGLARGRAAVGQYRFRKARARRGARRSAHRLFLMLRRILAAVALSLLPACSTLPTSIVPESATFDGMNALVAGGLPPRPLHVFAVHGMGTTTPDQFEGFIGALANRLRLVQISQPRGEPTLSQCTETVAAPLDARAPAPEVSRDSGASRHAHPPGSTPTTLRPLKIFAGPC